MAWTERRQQAYSRPLSSYALSSWVVVPLACLIGGFIGLQFLHLSPRYIKLVFGLMFLLAVTRLPFHLAMALFLIIWPAPTFVFFGDTNVIFLGLMLVIWFVRLRMGRLPARIPTGLDWAIPVYLGIHFLSFLNIDDPSGITGSINVMQFMIAGTVMFFLLVQAIRNERHLHIALQALCWTAVLADVTAIAEYYFGIRLIPEWFIFNGGLAAGFGAGQRAQGVFGFHGLLADFSAMSFYTQIMLGLRARTRGAKFLYYLLAAVSVLMIVDSANRGGTVIFLVGGVYFLWLHRRRVRWSRLALALPLLYALVGSFGLVHQQFLNRIYLLSRLAQTQLVRGIPDDRIDVWSFMIKKVPEHLLLGHGPFINLMRGGTEMLRWPHNAYLFYLYSTGILGLAAFLWIMGKVLWRSFPRGEVDFVRGSLARSTQAIFHLQVLLFALAQFRDEHQRGNVYIYLMWILFAFALIGRRLSDQERRAAAQSPGGQVPVEAGRG
jgi:O-antigen ligase